MGGKRTRSALQECTEAPPGRRPLRSPDVRGDHLVLFGALVQWLQLAIERLEVGVDLGLGGRLAGVDDGHGSFDVVERLGARFRVA